MTCNAEQPDAALKLAALELQTWGCLASCASWAPDVPAALEQYGATIGTAFQKRSDLQAPICNLLRRVSLQTSAALREFGDADGVAFAVLDQTGREDSDDESSAAASVVGGDTSDIPEGMTLESAQANRTTLRSVAGKWLPELLNRFAVLAPEERGGVGDAIAALSVTCGELHVGSFFKESLQKVVAALKCLKVCACSTCRRCVSQVAQWMCSRFMRGTHMASMCRTMLRLWLVTPSLTFAPVSTYASSWQQASPMRRCSPSSRLQHLPHRRHTQLFRRKRTKCWPCSSRSVLLCYAAKLQPCARCCSTQLPCRRRRAGTASAALRRWCSSCQVQTAHR